MEETIVGESENDILVNIAYQEQHKYTNEDNQQTLFDIKDPYYVKPETGSKYVLFLKKDELFGNYYGAIEPFQIKISSDNQVKLVTNQIVSNDLPEAAVVHDDDIHFKTVGQAKGETVEFVTELSIIKNFLEGYNLNQLKNEITNLAK
ncbi:hypothetical protein [Virgibacillus subterraneus]|uniref:hypothetical protein n=1 Tax=Virgibacillus subterraneus TaxID=621109 RepID=UPI000B206480|nr:hypothetical protein [Virgibacillus subterraneus]